jgi:hypothetical protein
MPFIIIATKQSDQREAVWDEDDAPTDTEIRAALEVDENWKVSSRKMIPLKETTFSEFVINLGKK